MSAHITYLARPRVSPLRASGILFVAQLGCSVIYPFSEFRFDASPPPPEDRALLDREATPDALKDEGDIAEADRSAGDVPVDDPGELTVDDPGDVTMDDVVVAMDDVVVSMDLSAADSPRDVLSEFSIGPDLVRMDTPQDIVSAEGGQSDVTRDVPVERGTDVRSDVGIDVARDTGADAPTACPVGQTRCGAVCVSTSTDRTHCGACGTSCLQRCQGGRCCGTRGEPCCAGSACFSPTDFCVGGTCLAICGSPAEPDLCSDNRCTNLATDPANCGRCGIACPRGAPCMGGMCQCGARGQHCCVGGACTAPSSCIADTCVNCPAGTAPCGDRCRDIYYDPAACGGCGVVCRSGTICQSGACRFSGVCTATFGNPCTDTPPECCAAGYQCDRVNPRRCCSPPGAFCNGSMPCCSGSLCTSGRCCLPLRGACLESSDCCTGVCVNYTCT